MPCNWNRLASCLHAIALNVIAIAVMAFAAATSASAGEAPPQGVDRTGGRTLPSADIVPDAPDKSPVPPNDPAVQAQLPGCVEWTDRCVTCQRDAGGITCSNIGIACQPKAVECVRAEPAEEKKR